MGNTGWRHGERKEVALSLHGVHNLEHAPNESFYGMATDDSDEPELPVTIERPAYLLVGVDSVVSLRVLLVDKECPNGTERTTGHLAIPMREVLDMCGPGLYQTWLLLDDAPAPAGDPKQRSSVGERFRRALHGVAMELRTPRICLSLLESGTDPNNWRLQEASRIFYYEPLLISQQQQSSVVQAYFDSLQQAEMDVQSKARLQLRQQEEEVRALKRELYEVTEEANRKLEKGNAAILKMKAELKQLREVEALQLQRERVEADERFDTLQEEGEELRKRLASSQAEEPEDDELQKLRQDVLVLANQKDALMKMVRDIYSSGEGKGAPETLALGSQEILFEAPR